MKGRTDFFKKFITSIYDLRFFPEYIQEGLKKTIIYGFCICLILGTVKGIFLANRINSEADLFYNKLSNYEYNINIKDGTLSSLKSPIVLKNRDILLYLDNNINCDDSENIKIISVNQNVNLFFLKDGLLLKSDKINKKINYKNYLNNITLGTDKANKMFKSGKLIIMASALVFTIVETFASLILNCIIVACITYLIAIFMKMIVKYMALFSISVYAATLPLIITTILECFNLGVNLDIVFIVGNTMYVCFSLFNIKQELINNLRKKNKFK
ncbi:DUF1189 family protein [Clostridium sp. BJN0001]|uniref:DUF1189 family protein n=1 Tax=Clostridium sp. BJN0001 TaxID=2930219 RepID=UPI001FD3447D|nr:DUF1189 family protein [Clostridium sp. BJN0001]